MAQGFIGEIRMFAGTFAPRDWAFCNGAVLGVNENPSLFSLIGSTHGGDGRSTFGLPEMRGRVPVGSGHGPSLTPRINGQRYGVESVELNISEMPSHNHPMQASTNPPTSPSPANSVTASPDSSGTPFGFYHEFGDPYTAFDSRVVDTAGNGEAHPNMMPYQSINFIIALKGIYPSRN
ncbi:phage tail protein [Marinomonas mediterranea]|jgi:Microcystin-dependent protein|uniref:Tail Collar domain protein n=1 Tax=Marinomonas mediterranea (strain ATCC 700492 / JCM 21426 / NBRC 103028 / MMB-1) TaxID=717774 RepID=F2JVJ0_MARM1|nr:tail fiber protein [Marinomonas mediterranea]ADZ90534.1 Tail Collar domain protein [Marinomonas mediterranea MMB-1]WCN16711.1 phage tail protein [Marinomonas mediterranea MMB-1]